MSRTASERAPRGGPRLGGARCRAGTAISGSAEESGMKPRSRLRQAPPVAPVRSGMAALVAELPPVPRWAEITAGACLALIGAVALAGMVWGGW